MLKRVALSLALLVPITGCTMTLAGGGEMSIGMRNDNFLILRHTIDGDKEGKEAQSKFEIDKSILEMVLPSKDESSADETSPDSE